MPNSNNPHVTTVLLSDGHKLHVDQSGSGPAALVLHGGPGMDCDHLRRVQSDLLPGHTLYFVDQRGSGNSEGELDPESISIDLYVDDMLAVLEALPERPRVLWGHSWGTLLAVKMAARLGSQLDKVTLVSPVGLKGESFLRYSQYLQSTWSPEGAAFIQQMMQKGALTPEEAVQSIGHYFGGIVTQPGLIHELFANMALRSADAVFRVFALLGEALSTFDLSQEAGQIQCPVVVIRGEHDAMPQDAVESLAHAIPKGQFVSVSGTSHFPFAEDVQAYKNALSH